MKGYQAAAPPRSLEEAYAQWRQIDPANIERAEYWLQTALLPRMVDLCADAVRRRSLDALAMWLNPDESLARLYRRLGAPAAERARRLIALAQDALRAHEPPDTPDDADLHHYYRTGRWRPAARSVRLTVALADADEAVRAVALTLQLEQVASPQTAPYAHPAQHWLLMWDEAFQASLDAAGLGGVRWSLNGLPLNAAIQGDSLGGAFALGAQLLVHAPGDHRRVATLARFDPKTHRLLPVEQFEDKYDAVSRVAQRIVVSPAQLSEPLPRVVVHETVHDALRAILGQRRRRRLAQLSLLTPLIPLAGLLWGLQQGSYAFTLTPSGRVMLEAGLITRQRIDTGYLASELYPDKLPMGPRWRWRVQPTVYDDAPYREIADALIDPFEAARLLHQLGDTTQALRRLPPPNTPIYAYRFQRLETLAMLQPSRRAQWRRLARQTPAPDPASRLAQLRVRFLLGDLPQDAYLRALRPLALPPHDDLTRLDALAQIAPHDPEWILSRADLRHLLQTCSVDRVKRGRALCVIALLSQQRLIETAPLIEPYRNDPLIQGGRELVEILIRMLLTGDETYYFQQRETVDDLYMSERVEARAIVHAFEGLLTRMAQKRPTPQAQWEFLLSDLATPFASRWGVHRIALMNALIAVTPPDQRPALRRYLQQRLQQPMPTHQRLALQYALQRLDAP